MSRLARLRWLNLSYTKVDSAGLAHLAACPMLEGLWLADTPVDDSGLPAVARLARLESLKLSGTRVTSAGLATIADLKHLTSLWLARTRIEDSAIAGARPHRNRSSGSCSTIRKSRIQALAALAHLARLEVLSLSNTDISDAGVAHLARLPCLRQLTLDGTRVTGTGLAGFTALDFLGLRGTPVADRGTATIGQLTALGGLDLRETAVTDRGLADLAALGQLEEILLRIPKRPPKAGRNLGGPCPGPRWWNRGQVADSGRQAAGVQSRGLVDFSACAA